MLSVSFHVFVESSTLNSPSEERETGAKDDEDDEGVLHANADSQMMKPLVAPRWPTRVFAIDCLLKIMAACEGPLHYDLVKAREMKLKNKADFLVLHLSELVRMAFIAATSDSDKLRLAGLAALQVSPQEKWLSNSPVLCSV